MTSSSSTPEHQHDANTQSASPPQRIALLGHPNAGKTTLFNALCGMRAKTANFPGSTIEARVGQWKHDHTSVQVIDLPGMYGLNLDRPESRVCKAYLHGEVDRMSAPDVLVIVADAANLGRHLLIVSQALQQGRRAVLVLNRIDMAQRKGVTIDYDELRRRVGCPVVAVSARSRLGLDALPAAVANAQQSDVALPSTTSADDAAAWAADVVAACVKRGQHDARASALTDRIDAIVTHPVLGFVVFAAIMIGIFYVIYTLAAWPMDLIELSFGTVGSWIEGVLPAGAIRDLLVNGVVAGIAGTVVFVPQIFLLFLLIALLEDTGYLARAAFVTDRLLRRFGLSGYSFLPLLSAHACAIPAIMSCRLVPDHRDRLATILVAPLMSCSARLPVYVLLIGLLFGDSPALAALAFVGCYALGAIVGVLTALILRRTALRGESSPMVMELPDYSMPSLRTAWLSTYDRTKVFLYKAGTVILSICIVLWWLGAYPSVDAPAHVTEMRTQATAIETASPDRFIEIMDEADRLEARHAQERSFIGRMGRTVEPVFRPLGYDWQITIGVLSSFAAREVFVSTMAVVMVGDESLADEETSLRDTIGSAERDDGTLVFNRATCASLLVFYVLALQCLPTLAVTRRETGGWFWAMVQLVYLTVLAYVAAFIVYRLALILL